MAEDIQVEQQIADLRKQLYGKSREEKLAIRKQIAELRKNEPNLVEKAGAFIDRLKAVKDKGADTLSSMSRATTEETTPEEPIAAPEPEPTPVEPTPAPEEATPTPVEEKPAPAQEPTTISGKLALLDKQYDQDKLEARRMYEKATSKADMLQFANLMSQAVIKYLAARSALQGGYAYTPPTFANVDLSQGPERALEAYKLAISDINQRKRDALGAYEADTRYGLSASAAEDKDRQRRVKEKLKDLRNREKVLNSAVLKIKNANDEATFGISDSEFKKILTDETKGLIDAADIAEVTDALKGTVSSSEGINNLDQLLNRIKSQRQSLEGGSRPTEAPSTPSVSPNERIINGVKYKKVKGGWQKIS